MNIGACVGTGVPKSLRNRQISFARASIAYVITRLIKDDRCYQTLKLFGQNSLSKQHVSHALFLCCFRNNAKVNLSVTGLWLTCISDDRTGKLLQMRPKFSNIAKLDRQVWPTSALTLSTRRWSKRFFEKLR